MESAKGGSGREQITRAINLPQYDVLLNRGHLIEMKETRGHSIYY